jgi:hypothetical protein
VTFQAHREIDPALLPGGVIAENACIGISVLRPN